MQAGDSTRQSGSNIPCHNFVIGTGIVMHRIISLDVGNTSLSLSHEQHPVICLLKCPNFTLTPASREMASNYMSHVSFRPFRPCTFADALNICSFLQRKYCKGFRITSAPYEKAQASEEICCKGFIFQIKCCNVSMYSEPHHNLLL